MNTSSIIGYLRNDPEIAALASAGDLAGIVARFNAATSRQENHTLRTIGSLATMLGAAEARAMLTKFQQAGQSDPLLASAWVTLSTTGLDFASPLVQATIDQLVTATMLTPEIGTLLKSLGVRFTSIADSHGGACTLKDVQDALAIVAREPLLAEAERRYNRLRGAIDSGQIADSAALVAQFGDAEVL